MSVTDLVDYVDDRASDYHRGTVRYEGETTEILYLREDVREKRLQSQIDRMLRRLRPETAPKEEQSFPLGDLRVTVRVFENAIILHFPLGPNRGIVVSLEPETAHNLDMFIGECERRLHE